MRIDCSDPSIALAMLNAHQASIDGNACKQDIHDDHDKEQQALSQAKEARHAAQEAAAEAAEDRDNSGIFGDIADVAGAIAGAAAVVAIVVPVTAPLLAPVALTAGVVAGGAKIGKGVEDARAADADCEASNHQTDAMADTQQANVSKMDASKSLDDLKSHVSAGEQQLSAASQSIRAEHASRARLCAQIGGA